VTYLVDANILIYATDANSSNNEQAREWLDSQLSGHPQTVALPWPTLTAFLRLVTSPRLFPAALSPEQAWGQVDDWLERKAAWVPVPGARHRVLLRELITATGAAGNLVADAHLAALAKENGLAVASADSDFAKFTDVKWINPIATPKSR
jgi:toxin-antitoxin system PIN domain toxin